MKEVKSYRELLHLASIRDKLIFLLYLRVTGAAEA